jgi:uncharacterized protein involved in response to NO
MLNIETKYTGKTAFLHLGFRPFFFAALSYAVVSIALWFIMYSQGKVLLPNGYDIVNWHAHEMIFGFAMATITGFLLTAVKNWTGVQTISQKPLLGLFLLWLISRGLAFISGDWVLPTLAVIDSLYLFIVMWAFSSPIFKKRQWKNLAFSGKLLLMLMANIIFYLGLLGYLDNGIHVGLYIGFYTMLAVIFNMGRRVIPFFIEKGLGCPFEAKNYKWVDASSLWLFLSFSVADIFIPANHPQGKYLIVFLALSLVVLHGTRLYGWYHKAIWKKSLLWVLYIGYAWIVLGFLLKALSLLTSISPFLALHAFSYGGVGMITSGMMARVSLGHTGNNVFEPPKILHLIFALLFIGAIVRIILPIFFNSYYLQLIETAQILWIMAFSLFFIRYAPMLIKARVDGRFG